MIPTPTVGVLLQVIRVLLQVIILTFLLYCPALCYLDIKYREVEYHYWIPLLVVNVPIWLYMYSFGYYPWYAFAISIVLCIFWYMVMRMGYIEGADMLFLWWISLFCMYNPYPYDHGFMAFPFMVFFGATMAISIIFVFTYNLFKYWRMTFKFPRGFPVMIPVCAAFILTVMYG